VQRAILVPLAAALLGVVLSLPTRAAAEPGAEAPGEPAPSPTPGAALFLEELVVTARRHEERLEDTPLSVTALSAATLAEASVSHLAEIRQLVPSLNVTRDQIGRPQFFLRGVGSPPGLLPGFAFDPGVGVYVDGVYLSRAAGSLLDIVDVERIEVLRGPQGTLFGKNTVGGAINVVTAKPRPALEGAAMLRFGNYDSVDTRAMLNVPLGTGWLRDRLFVRAAFGSSTRDGYVENVLRDESLSDLSSLAFVGTMRFVPTDQLTLDLSGTWNANHARQRGGECVFRTDGVFGALVPPDPETGETFFTACRASRPFVVESDVDSLIDAESEGTWLDARWSPDVLPEPLDSLTVRSLTAWQGQSLRARFDVDMTRFFLARHAEVGGAPGNGGPRHQRQVSQELQLGGSAWQGRLPFVAGYFVQWETGGVDADLWALPQVVDIQARNRIAIDNWTWAVFGQSTWNATDWLSLTGGLRYTEEKKGVDVWWTTPFTNPEPVFDGSADAVYSAWTPTASIATKVPAEMLVGVPVDHAMAYFTYARGFRGGGFDAIISPTPPSEIAPVRPEHLDSFEIGVKTIAAGQRLILNTSVYTSLYDDVQVQTIVASTNAFDPRTVVLNAASARIRGLELELLALPLPDLRIEGSLSLLHGRFDAFESVSATTGLPVDRAGERLPYVPDVQSHLALQYSIPIAAAAPWLSGRLTPRIEWYHQSETVYVAPELPLGTQPAYDLLNARLSYAFLDDRAEIALWARNLTDEAYFDFAFNLLPAGTLTRYYELPRTFGVELRGWF
jgi:iron complex outermembrane receptor protein